MAGTADTGEVMAAGLASGSGAGTNGTGAATGAGAIGGATTAAGAAFGTTGAAEANGEVGSVAGAWVSSGLAGTKRWALKGFKVARVGASATGEGAGEASGWAGIVVMAATGDNDASLVAAASVSLLGTAGVVANGDVTGAVTGGTGSASGSLSAWETMGAAAVGAASVGLVGGLAASTAGAEPLSSISPVPRSSQGMDTSGKASIMRCTTSKLGLLRSLRMWLITGRPTPMASAN